jgi:FimV-like protein
VHILQQAFTRLGRVLLLGIGCLLLTSQAVALTLGDLVVHSRPGEPLRASILLRLQGEEQLAQVHVTLATAEGYQQQQLELPAFLEGMRIGLLSMGEANARIQLFGKQPWQGEESLLLLQIAWPQGQLSERFRLAGVSRDEEGTEQMPLYVEVAEKDTLDAIAIRLSAGRNRSYLHMMYALFLANPDAFYLGNMNNLKGGVRLRVPSEEELYRLNDAQVFNGIRQQYEQWKQPSVQSPMATTQAGIAVPSEMSNAKAGAQDLKGEPRASQQQQLQQLAEENEAIQRRNQELKARLARLEQQMQKMTEQVLDYTPAQEALPVPAAQEPAASPVPESEDDGKTSSDELPAYVMLLAMLVALGAGVLVWHYAAGRQGRGP